MNFRRITLALRSARRSVSRALRRPEPAPGGDAPFSAGATLATLSRAKTLVVALGAAGLAGYFFYTHPPVRSVPRGEVGIRVNQLTGSSSQWRDGTVIVLPGLHEMRTYSLRDQMYRPAEMSRADGAAPLQSREGLSLGVDLQVRYALDPARLSSVGENPVRDVVEPAVQGTVYKVFARYTVREIFSTKRAEIQQVLEAELKPRLAADGVLMRGVQVGKVDLPDDYRRGMEVLLAEELATEKMRYTLELKDKRVKESELEASAEKVRREVRAEAAAREQVIAAKAQEEAMKHVLPFKQRQIEQSRLEAEAQKVARIRAAEGSAEARRIEANGEALARQRLAEAEVFRLERVGKANAEQMAREGALVTRHPLLIQKTLADKLSDKIQVVIAPPPSDGGFIGATLLGGAKRGTPVSAESYAEQRAAVQE